MSAYFVATPTICGTTTGGIFPILMSCIHVCELTFQVFPMRAIALILPLTLVILSSPATFAARDRPFIDEMEPSTPASVQDRDTTWKEGATNVPPWPKDGDLIEFSVDDPSSQFRQFIDGKHISVGADGAVRYTLVVESRSGARNVSFEGLRCTPHGAFKIYAYGDNGRFEEAKGDWISLHGRVHDKIHEDLHKQILCVPRKFEPRSTKNMIHALQTRIPHDIGTGFVTD